MGEPDDWNLIFKSRDTPWTELFKNLSLPWSTSKYWFSQVDGIDQIAHKRIVHGLVLKSIEAVFGCHFLPFYLLAKAIFFAGVVTLFFLFAYAVAPSLPFAIAGSLFFLLVPAHYSHVLWVADPITIAQFFIILGIWIFFHISRNLDGNGSLREFMALLCSFLVIGTLGIKTKEPALIVPMTASVYTLLRAVEWKTQKRKLVLLGLTMAFLGFQIIPVEHLGATGQGFGFHWENLIRLVFKNHHCGYVDESATAFFSAQRIWPVSIARTFGFFSLWLIIFFIALYWIKRIRMGKLNSVHFFGHPLIALSGIWVGIEVSLMGIFQPEPRFMSGTFIPLTVLAIRLVWCVYRMATKRWKPLVLLAAILAGGWTAFYNNLHSVLWLRSIIGQRNNQFVSVAKILYQDQLPTKSCAMRDISLFYCPRALYGSTVQTRMEDVAYYTQLPRESWNKTQSPSLEDFSRYAQKGFVYWTTFSKDDLIGHPNIVLLKTVDGLNKGSILEYLIFTKFPLPDALFIFKYIKDVGVSK